MIPDLMSQKVYIPALVFIMVKLFVHTDKYSEALIFGISYYFALKYLTHLSISKQDIIMPMATLFVLFPSGDTDGPIAYKAATFMLTSAVFRMVFPSN